MALILDTGPVIAALNEADRDHRRCRDLLENVHETLVIPSATLVEIDYWIHEALHPDVWTGLVQDIADGAYRLEPPTDEDLVRATELQRQYADLRLGFVDASVIALCERLGERKVATLDRRHFSVVRPRHVPTLELLPD